MSDLNLMTILYSVFIQITQLNVLFRKLEPLTSHWEQWTSFSAVCYCTETTKAAFLYQYSITNVACKDFKFCV